MHHALLAPWLVPLVALGLAEPARGQGDPFAPATRWRAPATAATPWIPASVDFAAGGELVFAAGALSTPRWMVFSSVEPAPAGIAQPWFDVPATAGSLSNMQVRAAARADQLFSLCQVPAPDSAHRRTELARFDALASSQAQGLARAWTHDLGWRVGGNAKLAVAEDGSRALAAVHDSVLLALRIDWVAGSDGSLQHRLELSAGTLRQLAASADLGRVAIVAGQELWVFDSQGSALHHEPLIAATHAMALSGDGRSLLIGAPGQLRVLAWNGAVFVERGRELAPLSEVPVRCALSHDGATWAAAWWNASTGRDVRLELRGAPGDQLLWEERQSAPTPSPQNLPETVCITRDGRRAAFGLWGSQDAQPEVVLVDRDTRASVASLDLPGSSLALALDPSGTRLAIGMKHAHANQFATTGEVRLYDTGERDVQAASQAELGQPLSVTARRAGARRVVFLYGPRARTPRPLAGVGGTLWLSRGGLALQVATADASGRASAQLPVPWTPSTTGVPFSVQAAFRSPAGTFLSASVLDPVAF